MFLSRSAVNSVSFSPCGGRIASASRDCTIKVWEASTGTCQSTLTGHSERVNCVVFSPNGKVIASCSGEGYNRDNSVRLWDAATGAAIGSPLSGHGAPVTQLEFRDATTLVSASDDGTTRFWDMESGAEKGQDAQGTHGEALAGERFAFSKKKFKRAPQGVV